LTVTRHARIVEHEIQAHFVPRGNTSLNTHRNKDEHRKKDDLLFSVPVLLLSNYETSVFPVIPKVTNFAEKNENKPSIASSFKTLLTYS